MASNLRAKLPKSDTVIVHDINADATSKFKSENEGVEVASSVREVAVRSVGHRSTLSHPYTLP